MGRKFDRSFWLGSLLCLLTIAFGLIYYSKLPESIAIHFNTNGEPNGYAQKQFVVFVFPFLMTLLHIIVNLSAVKEAKKGYAAKFLIELGRWSVPIAVVIIQPLIILKSAGSAIPINIVVSIIVGTIFIISGNFLPKNRPNSYAGLKFPWLIHYEEGWRKTHKLAGYLWIITGHIMIISPFVKLPFYIIMIVILTLTVLIPIIYSLHLYRHRGANEMNPEEKIHDK